MKLRPALTIVLLAALVGVIALPKPTNAQEDLNLKNLGTECVATELNGCRVMTSGYINTPFGDDEGTPMLAWQTQYGFTDEDGVLAGFVLLKYGTDGWAVMDSGFDGARFQLPQLN